MHPGERENYRFGPGEHEGRAVAMARGGAIAGRCGTEFGWDAVVVSVVVEIDEVETDGSGRLGDEHRARLLSELVVDCPFELVRDDGAEPFEHPIAAGRLGRLVGDGVDR